MTKLLPHVVALIALKFGIRLTKITTTQNRKIVGETVL